MKAPNADAIVLVVVGVILFLAGAQVGACMKQREMEARSTRAATEWSLR